VSHICRTTDAPLSPISFDMKDTPTEGVVCSSKEPVREMSECSLENYKVSSAPSSKRRQRQDLPTLQMRLDKITGVGSEKKLAMCEGIGVAYPASPSITTLRVGRCTSSFPSIQCRHTKSTREVAEWKHGQPAEWLEDPQGHIMHA